MIAVDSSAIIAVVLGEGDAEQYAGPINGTRCVIGWPTVFEIYLVLTGHRKATALEAVSLWMARPNVETMAFDERLFQAANLAFQQFGKGMGHPAQLNFGDCMAYAVARVRDVPLLYKGEGFSHTDIRPALP
jgi:ribonuclease VapC